jgi:hypothetical protein
MITLCTPLGFRDLVLEYAVSPNICYHEYLSFLAQLVRAMMGRLLVTDHRTFLPRNLEAVFKLQSIRLPATSAGWLSLRGGGFSRKIPSELKRWQRTKRGERS